MNRSALHPLLLVLLVLVGRLSGHDATPVTHSFDRGTRTDGPLLTIRVTDGASGRLVAARLTVAVDGKEAAPEWVDENGIRFSSIHLSKKQFGTTIYARGTGPLTLSLPAGAQAVDVTASRGFEYASATASARVADGRAAVELALNRWIDLAGEGWIAADEHLHYDRLDPTADAAWLTMLEADGLQAGHFMTLKGGMTPGVWARQFAYGRKGQATDGARIIVPGEEYRDRAMGHINLLGLDHLIEPISTGGFATDAENFPPFHDVMLRAREAGAITGVAHGSTLGRQPTAVADAVLGAVDFWEVCSGAIYSTEIWYRLMNAGIFLPPAAGTDLPNWPFRDGWQPLLGSARTYVHTGGRVDFESFKTALARGRVFVTSGPIIDFSVNDQTAGSTITLPPGGGEVVIKASLSSARPLQELHLIHNGGEVPTKVAASSEGAVNRRILEQRMTLRESGWIAVWGKGEHMVSQDLDALAHSGVVRVIVGGLPVRVHDDVAQLVALLRRTREYYEKEGRYRTVADRQHVLQILDRARERLESPNAPQSR